MILLVTYFFLPTIASVAVDMVGKAFAISQASNKIIFLMFRLYLQV